MKAKLLLAKIKGFRDLLEEHFKLYSQPLSGHTPEQIKKINEKLFEQEKILHRLFYPIDEYITKLSKGRLMVQPITGRTLDIYRASIGKEEA